MTASEQQAADTLTRYQELLLAVAQKHPGEDRHQTALRYIREREDGAPVRPLSMLEAETMFNKSKSREGVDIARVCWEEGVKAAGKSILGKETAAADRRP